MVPLGCVQGQTQSGGDNAVRGIPCVAACVRGGSSGLIAAIDDNWGDNGDTCTRDSDPCSAPNYSLQLTADGCLYFNSSNPIAGFQFNVDGAIVISAIDCDSEAAGFTMPTGGNIVLGFSLQGSTISGCGAMRLYC